MTRVRSITLAVMSARVWAMEFVPLAKAFISNTPMGPFQMTDLASWRAAWNFSTDLGPMSSPCMLSTQICIDNSLLLSYHCDHLPWTLIVLRVDLILYRCCIRQWCRHIYEQRTLPNSRQLQPKKYQLQSCIHCLMDTQGFDTALEGLNLMKFSSQRYHFSEISQ